MSKSDNPATEAQDPSSVSERAQGRGALRRWLLLGVPLALALVGGWIYLHGGRFVETDNAYLKADKLAVSSEVTGAISQVLVRENEAVSAGQALFRIDARPYQLALQSADAQLAQVRADLTALKSSYRETQAQIELAQTRSRFAEREERRLEDLLARKFVSSAAYDDAQQAAVLARQALSPLQRELERIADQLGGRVDAPFEQHPRYRVAMANREQAQLDLERCEIRAPSDGTVSGVPKNGQYLRAGDAAIALVTSGDLWIEANFTETDLTHVRPGQPVSIHVDTFPGAGWQGVVDSLSPATGAEFSLLPAQNATGNWVKIAQRVPVRIRFDDQVPRDLLRAGLSAEVQIDTGHRRELMGFGFGS
ncbi:MAG: HlyD family secretion protein [Lysobacterales bacterium]